MTSWDINVSNGTIALNDGAFASDALLYFGLPDDVYFLGIQSFADFQIHRANTSEPNMQIETTGSPTKSLLFDCSIGGFDPNVPPIFQFEQSFQFGQWINKSIVTPSAGHVFYGISPVDWGSDGIANYTTIRLQPTPDSPGNVWQFFGCELTFVP